MSLFLVIFSYMGICLEKCHFGFSKSSKFKRVVLLILNILRLCTILPYEFALKSKK